LVTPCLERPKSVSFKCPSLSKRTFSGFKSLYHFIKNSMNYRYIIPLA
jgi:hypothetical protein